MMRSESAFAFVAILALVPMIVRATAAGTLPMWLTTGLLIALMVVLTFSHKLFTVISALLSVVLFVLGNSHGRAEAGVLLGSVASLALMLFGFWVIFSGFRRSR
jgi:hypothetical protein